MCVPTHDKLLLCILVTLTDPMQVHAWLKTCMHRSTCITNCITVTIALHKQVLHINIMIAFSFPVYSTYTHTMEHTYTC